MATARMQCKPQVRNPSIYLSISENLHPGMLGAMHIGHACMVPATDVRGNQALYKRHVIYMVQSERIIKGVICMPAFKSHAYPEQMQHVHLVHAWIYSGAQLGTSC